MWKGVTYCGLSVTHLSVNVSPQHDFEHAPVSSRDSVGPRESLRPPHPPSHHVLSEQQGDYVSCSRMARLSLNTGACSLSYRDVLSACISCLLLPAAFSASPVPHFLPLPVCPFGVVWGGDFVLWGGVSTAAKGRLTHFGVLMSTPLGQTLLAWQVVIHGLAVSGGRRHVGAGAASLSLLFLFPGF